MKHLHNHLSRIIILITLIQLISCRKDSPASLISMDVLVIPGQSTSGLFWDKPVNSANEISYLIYLDEKLLVSDLSSQSYSLSGLIPEKNYSGRIEAWQAGEKIAEGTFSFTTLADLAPLDFKIREIGASGKEIFLKWDEAEDPEGKEVVYDIVLANETVISGLVTTECKIQNLLPATIYSGKVVARDVNGKHVSTDFRVMTQNADQGTLFHRFIKFEGREREYAWYLPPVYGELPLVIHLHGANGNAWNEIQGNYFNDLANRQQFIHLMPQSLLGTYNGETIYQWNAHDIFSWNDVHFLNQIIDEMAERYTVDLSRVYITGMSNGGFMTYYAMQKMQNRIAAIAPISGLISTNIFVNYSLQRTVPLCYMHGTADPIVYINGSPSADDIIEFWAQQDQIVNPPIVTQLPDLHPEDLSTVTLMTYTGFVPDAEILYYRIEGGGHSIPGIEAGANQDINAYEEIWKFFKRHSYPAHSGVGEWKK